MILIQKGKANWKYILVVVILATIAGGIILSYWHWWLAEQTVEVPKIEYPITPEQPFTGEDFGHILSSFLGLSNFEVKSEIDSSLDRCMMHHRYEGQINGNNQYALKEDSFIDDSSSLLMCERHAIKEVYLETYWIGEKIFNRQYKEKDFEELSPESQTLKAHSPLEEIEFLTLKVADYQEYGPISVDDKGKTWEVKATLKNKEIGEDYFAKAADFVFIIDKRQKTINKISAEVVLDAAGMMGYLSYEAIFIYPARPIEPPFNY